MTSEVCELHFDRNGLLWLRSLNGPDVYVRHPEGLIQSRHVFEGGRIVAGAFTTEVGSGNTSMNVDFLSFTQPWTVQRWTIDATGACCRPREISLATEQPIGSAYVTSPHLTEFLRKRGNDLEIYTLLRMLCGRRAATSYLQSCVANHRHNANSSCRLVVIFNHHYIRNCSTLYDYYHDQFPDIDFVLPCTAPHHQNYFSYPFGSFQFHGLISGYLQDQLRTGSSAVKNYFFIQDDILVHPRINADFVTELLSVDRAAWFPTASKHELDSNTGCWAPRIRNAFRRQRDDQLGNGFEGLWSVVSQQHLRRGFSDCFALSRTIAKDFVHRLSPMVAANLFPELAIPTALFNTVSAARMKVARQLGIALWREQRSKVNDPEFLDAFLASDAAFLHPVKIAADDGAVFRRVKRRSI